MALMCNAAMATDPALPDDAALPSAIAPWEGLRDILRDAQLALLPSETPVVHDLGELLLLPDGTLLPVDTSSPPGAFLSPFAIYHLSLFEDPGTRATVFLDGDGALLHELPAEEGYSPAWVYNAIYNLQLIIDNSPDSSYDPSLVTLTATLSDPFGLLFEGVQESGSPEVQEEGGVDIPACDQEIMPPEASTGNLQFTIDNLSLIDAPATNAPLPTVGIPLPPGGVVYVDAVNGDDALTGRSAVIARGDAARRDDGPKRTLSGGMVTLDEENAHTLVIREGNYPESLDLRGRDVLVKVEGTARIGKAASKRLPPSEKRPDGWVDIPPSAIPTNTVRHLP